MANRASGTFALSPKKYSPVGKFWNETKELDRFPPRYDDASQVFEEYMANPSMHESRHVAALKSSAGLMELHYNTMRKKALERSAHPASKATPSMDRAYDSCSGYSGFIPGKLSNNICGCTFTNGSRLAHDTRGRFFPAPMSGLTYTLGSMSKCSSMPNLENRPGSAGSTLSNAGNMSLMSR
eukprot:TRINITY_DN48067_c0_g1_i1.p1 TRINITY_DN48067_c0_g1~~TRINITY_DN48067_c0_g1_i1.p1  ORF type:complete len:210 (+),score=32.94 TRINITY_DN48067_c0_g1_i1:87-632(+)